MDWKNIYLRTHAVAMAGSYISVIFDRYDIAAYLVAVGVVFYLYGKDE